MKPWQRVDSVSDRLPTIEEIVADLSKFDTEKTTVAENSPTQTNETRTKALVGVQSY